MPERELCLICQREINERGRSGRDSLDIDCPGCGRFSLSRTAVSLLPHHLGGTRNDHIKRAALSHHIRRVQSGTDWPLVDWSTCQKVIEEPYLPSLREQADNLIFLIGNNSPAPGERVTITPKEHQSVVGSASEQAFHYVITYLVADGALEGTVAPAPGAPSLVQLTFKGWDLFEDIAKHGSHSRKAFLAMKFGDAAADGFFETVIKPAVAETGFTLMRLDDNPRAGLIDDRMRVEIRNAKFVVADLTHANLGAYWEAGFAEGLGKPVIYTCQKDVFDDGTTIHFDTSHLLTVKWDASAPAEAANSIKATIRATLPELAKQED